MAKAYKSEALAALHESMSDLHQAGAILGLGGQNRVHAGGVDVDAARRQSQGRTGQVE